MDAPQRTPRWYWERYTDGDGRWRPYRGRPAEAPPGEDLVRLRRGAGRVPGTVPEMWPYYSTGIDDERLAPWADEWDLPGVFVAEHHALVLYGFHQQSIGRPMHVERARLGRAVRALHTSGRYSQEAVDRRFFTVVTTDDVGELAIHLRGLIGQLKTLRSKDGAPMPQALDYSWLQRDLEAWQWRDRRELVRRRWGLEYHLPGDQEPLDGLGEIDAVSGGEVRED